MQAPSRLGSWKPVSESKVGSYSTIRQLLRLLCCARYDFRGINRHKDVSLFQIKALSSFRRKKFACASNGGCYSILTNPHMHSHVGNRIIRGIKDSIPHIVVKN